MRHQSNYVHSSYNPFMDNFQTVLTYFSSLSLYDKDPTARIHKTSLIGPNVVLGTGVVVKEGSRIRNSTILSDTIIESHCWIDSCLIGWNCEVGSWVWIWRSLFFHGSDRCGCREGSDGEHHGFGGRCQSESGIIPQRSSSITPQRHHRFSVRASNNYMMRFLCFRF